jgi:hypothetical protein
MGRKGGDLISVVGIADTHKQRGLMPLFLYVDIKKYGILFEPEATKQMAGGKLFIHNR